MGLNGNQEIAVLSAHGFTVGFRLTGFGCLTAVADGDSVEALVVDAEPVFAAVLVPVALYALLQCDRAAA